MDVILLVNSPHVRERSKAFRQTNKSRLFLRISCRGNQKAQMHDNDRCHFCNVALGGGALKRHRKRPHLYKCPSCTSRFLSSNDLTSHANKQHPLEDVNGTNVVCHLCDAPLPDYAAYRSHAAQAHDNVRLFNCELCSYWTTEQYNLYTHSFAHTDTTPFNCEQCMRRFKKLGDLCNHRRVPHVFFCDECVLRFTSASQLVSHAKKTHDKENIEAKPNSMLMNDEPKADKAKLPLPCHMCGIVYSVDSRYKHMRRPHLFKCTACERCFPTRNGLVAHAAELHAGVDVNVDNVQCHLCDAHLNARADFAAHATLCHPEVRLYSCDKCSYWSANRDHLVEHQLTHEDTMPFECTDCAQRFRLNSNLTKHRLRWHTFVCTECSECFSKLPLLNEHRKNVHNLQSAVVEERHRNGETGTCHDCDIALPKGELKTHIRAVHPQQRLHECEQCDYWTPKFFNLKCHMRRHGVGITSSNNDNAGIYRCEHCAYASKVRQYFLRHVREKHNGNDMGSEKFTCALCGVETTGREGFLAHLSTLHANEKDNKRRIEVRRRCWRCAYVSMTAEGIKAHFHRHHPGAHLLTCPVCGYFHSKRSTFGKHILTHTKERQHIPSKRRPVGGRATKERRYVHAFECGQCARRFITRRRYQLHVASAHDNVGDVHMSCDKCEVPLQSVNGLLRHILASHTDIKVFQCDKCSYWSQRNTPQGRRKHSATHEHFHIVVNDYRKPSKAVASCSFCDRHFVTSCLQLTHESFKHRHACTKCPKRFIHRTQLRVHIKWHKEDTDRLYVCVQCPRRYSRRALLQEHQRVVHADDFKKEFEKKLRKADASPGAKSDNRCTFCDQQLSRNDHLKYHERVAHKYKCEYCPRRFVRPLHLHRHQAKAHELKTAKMTHFPKRSPVVKALPPTPGDRLVCRFCNLRIARADYMHIHETKPHDFHCTHCDYSFTQAHRLHEHRVKVHLRDIKPERLIEIDANGFRCTLCDYNTGDHTQLEAHVRTHELKMEQCKVCGKRVRWMRHHIKTMHGEQLASEEETKEVETKQEFTPLSSSDSLHCILCAFTSTSKELLDAHFLSEH